MDKCDGKSVATKQEVKGQRVPTCVRGGGGSVAYLEQRERISTTRRRFDNVFNNRR